MSIRNKIIVMMTVIITIFVPCVCILWHLSNEGVISFTFNYIPHGETGEPVSLTASLIVYGFIGLILCVLLWGWSSLAAIICSEVLNRKKKQRRFDIPKEIEFGFEMSQRIALIATVVVMLIIMWF